MTMVIAPSDNENPEQGSIDHLMANPIPNNDFDDPLPDDFWSGEA